MAGQFRSALDQFAGVRLVPFWVVAVLAIVYILLDRAGRLLLPPQGRRPHAVDLADLSGHRGGAVGVGAYLLAHGLKGDRASHQPGRSGRRGRGLGTGPRHELDERFQSPHAVVRSFRAALAPLGRARAEQPAMPLAWLGLPGKGLGGMDPQTTDPVGLERAATTFRRPGCDARRCRFAIWSSRSLTARWSGRRLSPV